MSLQRIVLFTLFTTFLSHSFVYGGAVQRPGIQLPANAATLRNSVKQVFNQSYSAYRDLAFGHDNIAPVSGGSIDGRNGWGATIVDAMSTMHIMGLDEHFKEAADFASKIDFSKSKTPDTVSVFEATIRYIGGLLSAYELSGKKYPALRDKAKEVADKLKSAFQNPVPYRSVNFATNAPIMSNTNIAEAGTLTLEWSTLSKHAGNPEYQSLAEGSTRHIASVPAPLPGLPAQGMNPSTGEPVGGYVTWGGGSDSYFEYLIKYARLTNTDDDLFVQSWITAVDSSIRHLLKASVVGQRKYLADYDDEKKIRHVSSHLACFHAGNWIYGGKLINNDTIVDIGLQLNDACWNTYASTMTGIGPEVFAFTSSDGSYTGSSSPTADQLLFNTLHGFYIQNPGSYYVHRPEVLESNLYAWRATGDTKYIDRAATALDRFQRYLQVPGQVGRYSGLWDVNKVPLSNSDRIDDTESFWFAETLKYLYLTFDDPEHISLDKYVFNTEAHPFLAPPMKSTYKPGTDSESFVNPAPFKTQPGPVPEVSRLPVPVPIPSVAKGLKKRTEIVRRHRDMVRKRGGLTR